jgi:PAS domain S-box-containing protein
LLLLHQHRLRRRTEYQLRDSLQFEQKLSKLSSEFINLSSEKIDAKVIDVLAWIGQLMQADRSHMFRFNWDRTEFRITHLWEAEGVRKDNIVFPGLVVKDAFPWLFGNLVNGKDVIVSDIEILSSEKSFNEYQYCREIGIQSFIILPIQIESAPLCAIGLDFIHQKNAWPREVQDRLRIMGEIVANTIVRRHAEKKSEVAKIRYRTVADFTYDWEYWENDGGTFEYVSPSCKRITGYTIEEFKTTPSLLKDIILPKDKAIWESHYHGSGTKAKPSDIQFRIKRKDGQIRWIEHVCQPVATTDGGRLGIRASNRDITERKQAEINAQRHREELTYISRMTTLGELSASMAHELNQPLTAILNNANAALRFISGDLKDFDEVNEILHDIIKDNRRASSIIKKLRTLMSKKKLEFLRVNLNEIVKDVVRLTDRETANRDVPVFLDLDNDLPHILGDVIHLEQVIINLILNGTEAMATIDHQLRELKILTMVHDKNHVKVSVSDQGTGIEEVHMISIFEAFYTTKPGGLGIGLSICRSIIEAHGGRLWAENNPDRGATVSFTVPVATGESV